LDETRSSSPLDLGPYALGPLITDDLAIFLASSWEMPSLRVIPIRYYLA